MVKGQSFSPMPLPRSSRRRDLRRGVCPHSHASRTPSITAAEHQMWLTNRFVASVELLKTVQERLEAREVELHAATADRLADARKLAEIYRQEACDLERKCEEERRRDLWLRGIL